MRSFYILDNSSAASDNDSIQTEEDHQTNEIRDEIKEVRRIAERETARINFWRMVVASALVVTGVAVTMTTYYSLSSGENDKFQRAVSNKNV